MWQYLYGDTLGESNSLQSSMFSHRQWFPFLVVLVICTAVVYTVILVVKAMYQTTETEDIDYEDFEIHQNTASSNHVYAYAKQNRIMAGLSSYLFPHYYILKMRSMQTSRSGKLKKKTSFALDPIPENEAAYFASPLQIKIS